MKTLNWMLLCGLLLSTSRPQAPNPEVQTPAFPGGFIAMQNHLARHLVYPFEARERSVEGQVVVEFTVQADGRLTDLTVRYSLGFGCDEAALAAVARMPNWEPGRVGNKLVPMKVSVPVTFRLDE